jgi:hypothetical protein
MKACVHIRVMDVDQVITHRFYVCISYLHSFLFVHVVFPCSVSCVSQYSQLASDTVALNKVVVFLTHTTRSRKCDSNVIPLLVTMKDLLVILRLHTHKLKTTILWIWPRSIYDQVNCGYLPLIHSKPH